MLLPRCTPKPPPGPQRRATAQRRAARPSPLTGNESSAHRSESRGMTGNDAAAALPRLSLIRVNLRIRHATRKTNETIFQFFLDRTGQKTGKRFPVLFLNATRERNGETRP